MIVALFKKTEFWLAVILAIGFLVRLYKIDSPVADWHSWRQADTAAVSRHFYQYGFNPFIPKYDNLLGESEPYRPNPQGLRFVEFPVYNIVVYLLYLVNGGVDEKLGRLVSIIASLGSAIFLFLIVKKYFGKVTAYLSAVVFLFLPFNIYFSRVILPEPALVFFSLGMFYFTNLWIWENSRRLYFISVFFTALAFLIKPTAIFYLLPLLYSYYQKEGKWWPIPQRYWLWLVLSLTPFFAWRAWISQFPEGIPSSNWLFNGTNIRFKPAFWRWILGDRFGREILTVTGTFLFFIGLLKKPERGNFLLHLLALSSFLFLFVFATGNVTHDYYQTLIVPALAIFVARGVILLIGGIDGLVCRIWTIPLAVLFFLLTFYLGWYEVKGLYQINNGVIVEAGQRADKLLPEDAVVIAPYNGDTAFLYQTNRKGLPIAGSPISEQISRFKVTHYVSVNFDAKTKWVMKRFRIIEETPKYVIVDLTSENPAFTGVTDPEPS